MASLIPWEKYEDVYVIFFSTIHRSTWIKFRMELGAFIIKEKLGIRDRETVEKIKENPYLK